MDRPHYHSRIALTHLLLLAGCASSGSGRSDATDAGPDGAPQEAFPIRGTGACSHIEIAYFVAEPSTIDRGESSTLSWDGGMARGCDLLPDERGFGGGPLSFAVTPESTTEYSLSCFGTACDGTDEGPVARLTVTVR